MEVFIFTMLDFEKKKSLAVSKRVRTMMNPRSHVTHIEYRYIIKYICLKKLSTSSCIPPPSSSKLRDLSRDLQNKNEKWTLKLELRFLSYKNNEEQKNNTSELGEWERRLEISRTWVVGIMALLHRTLITWLLTLIFTSLIAYKLDYCGDCNWFFVFIPSFLHSFVLILYIVFKMIQLMKSTPERQVGGCYQLILLGTQYIVKSKS